MARKIRCGINIDPRNAFGNPSTQELQALGATWVRFTFKDPSPGAHLADFGAYDTSVHDLHQAGLDTLLILSYETYPGKPAFGADQQVWDTYIDGFAVRCRQIAQHYGDRVGAYQIWNEPDFAQPTPGYDPSVREAVFGRMLRSAFSAIKEVSQATVVAGGLASGNASYIQRVAAATGGVLYADAVGLHPYGQRPTANWPSPTWGFGVMGNLVRAYHAAANKPIWITEIGTDSATRQGEFPGRTFTAMNDQLPQEAPFVFWFCWSDGMVSPYGLLQVDGQRKASYVSFQNFARQPLVEDATGTTPAVDYHSHYVLFPARVGWNWFEAARHYLRKYRVTRGESAEDAAKVHGTLGHTITCINPTPKTIDRLRQLNPAAHLDIIHAEDVQELQTIMDHRADNDLRFG
jgi:hypothetical protein